VLDSSARSVLAFLRDSLPFERLALAESITFYVAPEGGAGRSTVARAALRQPSAWVVESRGRRFSLVPPRMPSPQITTMVGRHLNCRETDVSTRVPALAGTPHVGTMLRPQGSESCLQTWNVTFVFDTTRGLPRLAAAVYDQWEW
jgi:hypothetical protein